MSTLNRSFPSARWTSYQDWDCGFYKQRLQDLHAGINLEALVVRIKDELGYSVVISPNFSAGMHWCCFELFDEERDTLLIARLQLPRYPGSEAGLDLDYRAQCELATMEYVRNHTQIPLPKVYCSGIAGSQAAQDVGAVYIVMEGFFGTTLLELSNITDCTDAEQARIFQQWASVQVELATLQFDKIGSIINANGELGPLSTESGNIGPFLDTPSLLTRTITDLYQQSIAEENGIMETRSARIGPLVHLDVVKNTQLFRQNKWSSFPLLHGDIGTQNLLFDENHKLLAVIDWEMAASGPWESFSFPMPFAPHYESDLSNILEDTTHIKHKAIVADTRAQENYVKAFEDAIAMYTSVSSSQTSLYTLDKDVISAVSTIPGLLKSEASLVLWLIEHHGAWSDEHDDLFLQAIARIAFGMTAEAAESYFTGLDILATEQYGVRGPPA